MSQDERCPCKVLRSAKQFKENWYWSLTDLRAESQNIKYIELQEKPCVGVNFKGREVESIHTLD